MAHVFIVNDQTFNIHLKYGFAGTGAGERSCGFLNKDLNYSIHPTTEKLLLSLIADVSRIRPGDKILFYLQQSNGSEGMFFGSFCAKEKAFLSQKNVLEKELGKKLPFRVEIEADEVYSKGITERECLDSLENIERPCDMCWSLIYRKLKGNRGCTMITDAEYEFIMNKIRLAKDSKRITNTDGFEFDSNEKIIINSSQEKYETLKDIKENFNIEYRMSLKEKKNRAFEVYLQAYILQNLESIKTLHVNNSPITWIGNEMACGVGMQSIDIAFIQSNKKTVDIVVCELKATQISDAITVQMMKYINWLSQYIIPTYKDKKVIIHPTIVAPTPKSTVKKKTIVDVKNSINDLSNKLENSISKARYISFSFENEKISFEIE